MASTKKPKGLAIARKGTKFTFTWKIADEDYDGGQQFEYRTRGKTGWRDWESKECGKKTTSKAFNISGFYPSRNAYVLEVQFRVRGNRKKYTKSGKDINPGWSDWSYYSIDISTPPAPTVTAALDSTHSNITTFTWSAENSETNKKWFSDVELKTALVKDCNYTDGSKAPYGASSSKTASGSISYTEDSSALADGHSYTRWVAVRSRGPAGDSNWKYAKHVYAQTNKAANASAKTKDVTGGVEVLATWNTSKSDARPIDSIVIQKAITTPAAGLTCPAGASWTDVATIAAKDGSDAYRWVESSGIPDDECLFVRINTVHDSQTTPGTATFSKAGKLPAPTDFGMSLNDSTHRAYVAAENASSVPDAHIAVVFRGSSIKPYIAGIIVHGNTDPITIQCPDWSEEDYYAFDVYAFVGNYTKQTRSDGLDCYTLSAYSGKPLLTSATLSSSGNVPKAPTGLTLSETNATGTVRATWNWTWTDADGTELSWADHEDAWESTSVPNTFDINSLHAGAWNISGLETGKTWCVRTRFYKGTGDDRIYGPYSEIVQIDLSVAPAIPVLQFSDTVIPADGSTTAYWGYVTNDGTDQAYAEICTATITSGVITYGNVIAHVETAYSIALSAAELGWASGNTYNLCVRVSSASGKQSEWSAPVAVTVAPALSCAISSTSLSTVTVPDDDDNQTTRQVLSLTELPMTVTVTGAGTDGTTIVALERALSYYMERPDESEFNGYEGETVALKSQTGASQMTISLDDLIGSLDDGAPYRIVATVLDGYGQVAETSLEFEVHWSHQAIMPEATVEVDTANEAVIITPISPTGALATDTCDIYRLSADKPELICDGVELDVAYVDPYPAIGELGGHRVVFKTANGDYITEDNHPAWIDLHADEGDIYDVNYAIIDFGDDRAVIKYNVDLSNDWKKDFQETRYLGGSIQGDWNQGVSRTSTVSGVAVTTDDPNLIAAMRRLSEYVGICHIRTPDGSSFSADVQVSEESSYDTAGKVMTYRLSITRVYQTALAGIRYSGHIAAMHYLVDQNGNYLLDENGAYILGIVEEE